MSNQRNSSADGDAANGNSSMLNHLLALATEAQGDRPADPSVSQMSDEDRVWLENALEQIAADSDPVKKLKRWMQRLNQIDDPSEANLADIQDILEEIDDLVCDMDLAVVFCTLGGISLIKKFIVKNFDPANVLFVHLLAVLAQYNPKVQQQLIKDIFLEHCLNIIVDDTKSVDYKHKCIGAISSMVKGFLPGLIRYIQLDGPDRLMRCFDASLQADEPKLVHRCAVAAIALKNSFSVEVVNSDQNFRKITQWPDQMKKKIEDRNDAGAFDKKYRDTLEFLS